MGLDPTRQLTWSTGTAGRCAVDSVNGPVDRRGLGSVVHGGPHPQCLRNRGACGGGLPESSSDGAVARHKRWDADA
jgi:hypothetical protein